jgi:hypothetical protein
MSISDERRQAWVMGSVAAWYLRPEQIDIYMLLMREPYPFVECSRRIGKTTSILCYSTERLRQNPGWVARWCEPLKSQAREIVMPEMEKIMKDCPRALRPVWKTQDSYYEFPNGSRLYLRGVNEDKGESARGSFAHIIVADEYGSWRDAEYIRNDILRPQIDTTGGQLIIASTPPRDLGHSYYDHKIKAEKLGRFIQKTIYENSSYSESKIQEIQDECGGPESATWRREYLCLPVADKESLVVPEFDEGIHVIPDDTPRPQFFDAYVGVDLGLNDNTAFLFGYFDFEQATLVIEDEWVENGKNTFDIVEAAKAKELALNYHEHTTRAQANHPMIRRIGDNELQQLMDMQSIYGYTVTPTRKDDKLAAINALRLRFREGRIKIKERCRHTRFQLKVGLWNASKSEFARGEKTGHLDAVDALIYLNRNLDLHHCPYPPLGYGMDRSNSIVKQSSIPSNASKALKKSFRPFG